MSRDEDAVETGRSLSKSILPETSAASVVYSPSGLHICSISSIIWHIVGHQDDQRENKREEGVGGIFLGSWLST